MDIPRTMFDKIWDNHIVAQHEDGSALIYVDRNFVHEGPFYAFDRLRLEGRKVRRPKRQFAIADHYLPTLNRDHGIAGIADPEIRRMVQQLESNARDFGIPLVGATDPRQGIMHVVGTELGLAQPGLVITAADSHTTTMGAFGAFAFGIGASEVTHVLATQTVWQRKPKRMLIAIEGRLEKGVTAKDVILAVIAKIGVSGGLGHAIEYAGSTVRGMTMEQRMTLCSMAIEAGARAGFVAPDETTFAYLEGRDYAPRGEKYDKAVSFWRSLPSDADAHFDRVVSLDALTIVPMVSWGTTPEDTLPITGHVPDPRMVADADKRTHIERALKYMGLAPGTLLTEIPVDRVFIGSCTNARIEDLRLAAEIVRNRRAVVPAMISPGSTTVKRMAEAEGLDRIFLAAGFEWRDSACSMCVGSNGDFANPGERCASTSPRNFENRQGRGVRTHLMSPTMAAAAAVTGRLTDVRTLN